MLNSQDFALSEIGQIAIRVKNLDRAVAFYRDTLGIQFLFKAPPQLAFFQCGSIRLMLSTPEKPEFDHPASPIYFNVKDIQQAYRILQERGAEFEGEPFVVHRDEKHELWMGFFRDPDRNLLAISSARML